jgi:hypothetical protein
MLPSISNITLPPSEAFPSARPAPGRPRPASVAACAMFDTFDVE